MKTKKKSAGLKAKVKAKVSRKTKAIYVVAALLTVFSVGGTVSAGGGNLSFWEVLAEKLSIRMSDTLLQEITGEATFGGSFTTNPTNLTSSDDWQAVNSLFEYGDLEVDGNTYLDGPVTSAGTTTLGYTPNQLNTPQVTFNSNSTTLCAVLNDSGVDRVISALSLNITGSSGSGANTAIRGYTSAGRVDGNTAVTSTLFKQSLVNVVASGNQVLGGPVPGSYYIGTSSTTIPGITTTTLAFWPNGWYANVTSTGVTSSTGKCVISSYPM